MLNTATSNGSRESQKHSQKEARSLMTNRLTNQEIFKSSKLTTKRNSDVQREQMPLSYSSNSLLAHSEHIKFPQRKTMKYFTPTRSDPYGALYNSESARSKMKRVSPMKRKLKAHLSARIPQD